MIIGYHASHEQFPPNELLGYVQAAEDAGFRAVMTSDHIAPWSARQGNSGNNWAWLGAAMAKTAIPFGSLAIPGGWRYHPVILAHLVATIAELFPGRLRWIAVGSGELLNEHVVGKSWPDKAERNSRLIAGSNVIRALLRGDEVSIDEAVLRVDQAKLWSRPKECPKIFGAALTAETTEWMGPWTDGLITVRKPAAQLSRLVNRFRSGGGEAKPLALQLQISWGRSRDEARMAAWDQWRNAAAASDSLANLRLPQDFDEVTKDVRPEEIDEVIPLITSGEELLALIAEISPLGFEELYIHSVSRDQHGFFRFMAHEVFPALS
jgi:coenzyme F420-dependent glucose-6-phosphate dehydrogenase